MKILKIVSGILLLLLFSFNSALAEVKSWELDKAHSNFYFSVDHIFSKVRGHFNDFKVKVNFDAENLAKSSFYFEIRTESIDTNIAKRDKHLLSADFFEASKYPLITFTSNAIVSVGNGGRYNVSGKLNIKGVDHDFTLPITLAGVKDHPASRGKEVIGFNGKVTLDRLEYKIGGGKFYDMGVVGKDVDVLVSLELMSEK